MLITLYRTIGVRPPRCRVISDHSGNLVSREVGVGQGVCEIGGTEVVPGRIGKRRMDRLLLALVKGALVEGYFPLYCYVPPREYPLTSRYILRTTEVDVVPDNRDGIPVWPVNARERGAHPTYLLFTIFSAEDT